MALVGVGSDAALGKVQHPGGDGGGAGGQGQAAKHGGETVKVAMNPLHVLLEFPGRAEEGLDVAGLAGPAPDFGFIDDAVLLAHAVEE
jgi:hypothetical protein